MILRPIFFTQKFCRWRWKAEKLTSQTSVECPTSNYWQENFSSLIKNFSFSLSQSLHPSLSLSFSHTLSPSLILILILIFRSRSSFLFPHPSSLSLSPSLTLSHSVSLPLTPSHSLPPFSHQVETFSSLFWLIHSSGNQIGGRIIRD